MNADRERSLRRLALQLAIQLPEGYADALDVLRYLDDIVNGYLAMRPGAGLNVVALNGDQPPEGGAA